MSTHSLMQNRLFVNDLLRESPARSLRELDSEESKSSHSLLSLESGGEENTPSGSDSYFYSNGRMVSLLEKEERLLEVSADKENRRMKERNRSGVRIRNSLNPDRTPFSEVILRQDDTPSSHILNSPFLPHSRKSTGIHKHPINSYLIHFPRHN
jgi:hypothetical protein